LKDTFLIHAFPGRLAGAIRSAERRLSAAKGTTIPKLKQAKHCPRNTWEMLTLQLSQWLQIDDDDDPSSRRASYLVAAGKSQLR